MGRGKLGNVNTGSSRAAEQRHSSSSDMDSDCDDVFTDDSKGYSFGDETNKGSPEPEDDGPTLNRKKRRGIIEKRRRDRINNSLSELRRLVPAAFEKQGSAKLEKAEILQMTVDHLRILHSKGLDLDTQGFVMDYHGIGFRECVSEVARYLVGFEGLDIQDPLRLRLMSHLQCFSAQRDVKSPPAPHPVNPTLPTNPWFVVPTPHYPPPLCFDRRTSSSGSAMSVDTNGGSSPRVKPQHSQHPSFSRRSTLGSEGKIQRSPLMPYRPWGAEVAY